MKYELKKVDVYEFNGWKYTFSEVCKDHHRIGITDPRGHFYGYINAPDKQTVPMRLKL